MNEPTPPLGRLLVCLTFAGLGVYALLGALALEWYPLLGVVYVCFAAACLPAIKLVTRH